MVEEIGSAEKQGGFIVRLSSERGERQIVILPPETLPKPLTDWQVENLIMSLESALWEKQNLKEDWR